MLHRKKYGLILTFFLFLPLLHVTAARGGR
jgi:hypothetical protein